MSEFDLNKFRNEFLQSDGWKVSDCYKIYDDKFLRKDAQDAYEGAKWAWQQQQAEIDELRKRIDDAIDYLHDGNQRELSYEYADAINDVIDILKGTTNEQ